MSCIQGPLIWGEGRENSPRCNSRCSLQGGPSRRQEQRGQMRGHGKGEQHLEGALGEKAQGSHPSSYPGPLAWSLHAGAAENAFQGCIQDIKPLGAEGR